MDYNNAQVYKLVNDVDDKVYVGSTCTPLAKRKAQHKSLAKKHKDRHVYKHMNAIGWENVSIILIESYPCENREQLLRRERYWMDALKPELNKVRPFVTETERVIYLKKNTEKKIEI